MKRYGYFIALSLAVGLSACGPVETATRNAPLTASVLSSREPAYTVTDLQVSVPAALKVSEANLFFPVADIVWRGEAPGNRHQQVQAIFETGMGRGAKALTGATEVVVVIEVMRFHSLTEKARYTFGGIHSIKFRMTVHDALSAAVILAPRVVKADLDAFGGARAIAAEANGITQKVRIESHLANVIIRELSKPQG